VIDDLDQIEESLTVLRAQRGDREAFRQLVDWYDRRLLYFVRRILGETEGAFDVLQSVWLIAHQRLWKLQSTSAFRVWLYRLAHDQAVTELRRRAKRPLLLEEIDTYQPVNNTSNAEMAFDNAELVHVALKDLSVDHRRVLTLRFLEDMSVEEIAEVVGCSSGTVKSRLHYAKTALRRRIEELLDG
jgi:RNA polymerase sigma-70 factor (ECF subfamily)